MEKKPWYLNIISGFSGQESSKRSMAIYTLILLVTGVVFTFCRSIWLGHNINPIWWPICVVLIILMTYNVLLSYASTWQDVKGFEQDILGKIKGINSPDKSEENKQ